MCRPGGSPGRAQREGTEPLRLRARSGHKGAWLGVTDRVEEGVFQGADGLPVNNEGQTWGDSQPNDFGGNEDCVEVRKQGSGIKFGQWNDRPCAGYEDYPLCQLR